MSAFDKLVDWLMEHPLVWLTPCAMYFVLAAVMWYLAIMIGDAPGSAFVYDL